MSKKHFEALAKALSETEPSVLNAEAHYTWRLTVAAISRVCSNFNPAFDSERFSDKCRAN